MQQLLALLPTDAVVGMITYGQMCFVHELGFAEMSKAYAFRGTKSVTAQQVLHRGTRSEAFFRGPKRCVIRSQCGHENAAIRQ